MTPGQIEYVRTTWAKVVPISDTAADLFYDKLFELDPSLRAMFPQDMTEQKKKLMQMIGVAVGALTKPAVLIPAVQDLGRRHVDYRVADEHYDTVGEALIWTLEQGLGPAFIPEVRDAWVEVYGVLSSTMKQAAVAAGR